MPTITDHVLMRCINPECDFERFMVEQTQTRRGKLQRAAEAFILGAAGSGLLYIGLAGMLALLVPGFAFMLSLTPLAGLTGGTLAAVKYLQPDNCPECKIFKLKPVADD